MAPCLACFPYREEPSLCFSNTAHWILFKARHGYQLHLQMREPGARELKMRLRLGGNDKWQNSHGPDCTVQILLTLLSPCAWHYHDWREKLSHLHGCWAGGTVCTAAQWPRLAVVCLWVLSAGAPVCFLNKLPSLLFSQGV